VKAVVVSRTGGVEVLSYRDVPDPEPRDDEVLIRVAFSALNFADILVREGTYHAGSPPPLIPGMDVAGTVEAAGPAAGAGVRVGQRVAATMGEGGYAELAVARADLVWPLDDGIDLAAGAAFPTAGITAYNVLTLAGRLGPSETLLVHSAAGGVGTTIAQIARLLGAGRVIGTVGTSAKVDVARAAGCDDVVARDEEDFVERVAELTEGRGVDVIADPVAGETMERGLDCLAPFGRLVAFGIASGVPGRVSSTALHPTNRAVVGYSTGHYRRWRPQALQSAGRAVLDLVARGQLRFVVGATFALEQAADAQQSLESGSSTGKLLLLAGGG
jgi:NADPH2:quinone reductase